MLSTWPIKCQRAMLAHTVSLQALTAEEYVMAVHDVHCVLFAWKDVVNFPELALSCVLIGRPNDNEYLTVDSMTLLHCPRHDDSGDSETRTVEAHLCLVDGILPPQPRVSVDEHQLCWSNETAETVILRLSSLLKQLLVTRFQSRSATCHNST